MTTPGEETYTLAQAQAELNHRRCRAWGHKPLVFSYDMTALCECGEYRWTAQPTAKEAESDGVLHSQPAVAPGP